MMKWESGKAALLMGICLVSLSCAHSLYSQQINQIPVDIYISLGVGLNNSGQVVSGNGLHAVLYSNGGLTDLRSLGEFGSRSSANDINNGSVVVGVSQTNDGSNHAFSYSGGTMSDLGTLGGTFSHAYAINDSNQIVGTSTTATGKYHAFSYSSATHVMSDLGAPAGANSEAYGINRSGAIVGYAATHAFLYESGRGMKDLGTLGGTRSTAIAINDAGQVVGGSDVNITSGTSHAFLYSGTGMLDLGSLGGNASSSYACDINNLGQVVGYSAIDATSTTHAFLYEDGAMTDLNLRYASLLVSGTDAQTGFTVLNTAMSINDLGDIAGTGTYWDGSSLLSNKSFLLSAAPEPSMWGLSGLGYMLVAMAVRVRKRINY